MRSKILLTVVTVLTVLALLGCPNPVTPPIDTVINLSAISGVTAPVYEATPVTTITETTQYTGTVAWNGSPTTFAASTVYTATITLTPKAGYTLTGVAANFFAVTGATATNSVNSGVVTAAFPATGAAPDTVINLSAISGVTAPVYGATPVTTITETAQYTGTVAWNGSPTTFAATTVYTATITLTPKAGYTLTGVAENFFAVTGATATNSVNSGVVTAVFPATGAAPDTVINLSAISGVTAPVYGATPVTTITETAQYTGTVAWNGSPTTFAASTVYTATITLMPKAGYTLTGVAANFFAVTGATATNSVNSGVVTAAFPATAPAVINIAVIPGVTAPETGATRVTTIPETAQYTGTVSWSPYVSNVFVSNTTYTATINLTAKVGFTLNGVPADFFTIAGTTSDMNPANSGVVTAVFPATTANLEAVTDYTGTGVGTLKAVQGGTFYNGTANMTVSSFRMSQYEVTGEQYATVMGVTDPSHFVSVSNNPVEKVTWYDAVEFCNKLSGLEGLTPVYTISDRTPATGYPITSATVSVDWSANGYRLPTEAEWHFAAQGGNSSSGYIYSGSDTLGDVAWYTDNSGNTTNTVGTKMANELGLYDMFGNVYEWCWDLILDLPSTAQTDYRGPDGSGNWRMTRGFCWANPESDFTFNSRLAQNNLSYIVGFRVVRP